MLRWLLLILVLAVGGVTAFFVFYHPPMRLMPPPLLFQQGGERLVELAPALKDGSQIEVFYATSRLPVGPRDHRIYTVAPDTRLHLGTAELTIGDKATPVEQVLEWTFGGDQGDRPFIRLHRMRESATLSRREEVAAAADWLAQIDAALASGHDRDLLVYVHGANTTVERAAGQASQLRHFMGRDAAVVLFAWPTAENFLRYGRDTASAFASAPQLAELLAFLAEHTDAGRIDLFTYSAGATVGSTALAILARQHPEAAARVGEVYHAAPDADFRDFVDDLAIYSGAVGRVTTAVNLGDSALRLSGVVNRASRAGRPDLAELSPEAADWLLEASHSGLTEIVQADPETMPDVPATSHTFWYDSIWASNDVLMTLLFNLAPEARGLIRAEAAPGHTYWTYPADYEARTAQVVEGLRQRLPDLAPELGAGPAPGAPRPSRPRRPPHRRKRRNPRVETRSDPGHRQGEASACPPPRAGAILMQQAAGRTPLVFTP